MGAGSFFPTDFILDMSMLVAAQLSLSCMNLRRLFAAQLLLSVATLFLLSADNLKWLHLPILVLSAAIATGERRPGRILEAAAAMFCTGAAAAGFFLMGGDIAASLAGCALLVFLLRRHRHISHKWNIEIQIEKNGVVVSIPALIDTGNRLKEHASSLPVLIVQKSAVPELADEMDRLDPSEIRSLPYGVLGGAGEIKCFRPDQVTILLPNSVPRQAPACYLAVFPGRIPGRTCALAPPEFTEAAEDKPGMLYTVRENARRCYYGVFRRKAIHLRHGSPISQRFGLLHQRQRSASTTVDAR